MIQLPNPRDRSQVADWVELNVSVTGEALSKSHVAAVIERAGGNEPSENFIGDVWRELERRQRLYSDPPFLVGDTRIEKNENTPSSWSYLACLILSLFGARDTRVPTKLFERISCLAVKRYISGKAIVFGWPFEAGESESIDADSLIGRKIRQLAEVIGEKFIEAPPARFNDRGVDVVGWMPFVDRRTSQSVLLVQCAAGHDWKDKLPVPLDAWCQYIHWAHNPKKAFAVPCVISESDWHEKSKDKGMLFDRIRLINLLFDGLQNDDLETEVEQWVRSQLPERDE